MARKNEKSDFWAVVEVLEPSGVLRGKSVSVTGHLGVPRKDFIRIVETAGGIFNDTPVWGTTYLVTNMDWNAGTTVDPKKSLKLKKAEQNRIKVISEEDFCKILMEGDAAMRAKEGQ